jgi:serine/threonine protein kinase
MQVSSGYCIPDAASCDECSNSACAQFCHKFNLTDQCVTPLLPLLLLLAVYMAPEIFDRDYHWEADMWSLGIMLYQLYARRFPFWRTYEECRHAKLDEVAALVAGG